MRSVLRATGATLLILASSLWAAPAQAQEKVSVAVLRFASSGGLFIAVEQGLLHGRRGSTSSSSSSTRRSPSRWR